MSKVKSTIFLVLLLALVNIATSTKLRTQIDYETSMHGAKGPSKKCNSVCRSNGKIWNGSWSNNIVKNKGYCGCN